MPERKNASRSKELDIVRYAFKNDLKELKQYIEYHPGGGEFIVEDVSFQYGNITRLVPTIDWQTPVHQFPVNTIDKIFHLDSINSYTKRSLEIKYQLAEGTLTKKSKADLLVITKENILIFSYKDGNKTAKLGQVSTDAVYHKAHLKGGHILPTPLIVNTVFKFSDTKLSEEQFEKINSKDRCFAWLKVKQPDIWESYVNNTMSDAIHQLKEFGNVLSTDKRSFTEFILITLFGNTNIPTYFNLLISDKIIFSTTIIEFLRGGNYKITCKDYHTNNKYSLLIFLEVELKLYGITKIEPAFDGSKSNVSQTKGIIYYFQQFPTIGNHIWQLLKDISE